MPSSMIPIFMPLPAVASFGPQSAVRADQGGVSVERRARLAKWRVADGGPDPGDARQPGEPAELGREDDGQAVQDDAVAPADAR